MGWVSGFLGSVFYNLVTRWTGGLLLGLDGSRPVPAGGLGLGSQTDPA